MPPVTDSWGHGSTVGYLGVSLPSYMIFFSQKLELFLCFGANGSVLCGLLVIMSVAIQIVIQKFI